MLSYYHVISLTRTSSHNADKNPRLRKNIIYLNMTDVLSDIGQMVSEHSIFEF